MCLGFERTYRYQLHYNDFVGIASVISIFQVILYKKFAPMGTVTSVKLCRDWVTGKSLCYAYVNFENPAEG